MVSTRASSAPLGATQLSALRTYNTRLRQASMTMQLGIAGSDAMALVSAPTIIRTRRNLAKPNPFNAVHKARRERAKLALKTQKKDSKGKKKTPKPKPKPKPVAAGGRSKSKKAAKADQAGKRCHEQNLHDAETEDEDEDGDTKMLGLPHVSKDKGKDKDRDIKMLDSDDKVDSDIEMSDAPSSDDIDEDIAMLDPAYVAYSSFTFQSPGTNPDPYSMEEDSEPIAFSRLWTNRQPSLEITPRLLGNLRMRIRDGNWSFKNVALSSHSKLPGAERAMLDLPTDPTDEGFASAYASFRLFQPIKQRHSKEGEEACEYCGPPPAEVVTAADIAADIAQAEAELEDMLAEESASPSPVATPEREATPPKRESTPIMCDLRNYEIPNCDDGEWEVPNVGVGMGYDVNDFLGDGWSEMSSDMSYMDDMIDWDEMGDEADS